MNFIDEELNNIDKYNIINEMLTTTENSKNEYKEKFSSFFIKEKDNILENFIPSDSPPFIKGFQYNFRENTQIQNKNNNDIIKNGIIYDKITKLYYDFEKNEYFEVE